MKILIKSLILLLVPIRLFGQLTPVTDQYVLNPLTINPAFAGNRGALNVAAFYRRQWVGIPGAPETMTLTFDAPFFNEKVGLGIIIISDKVGITREKQFISDYAYKLKLGEGTVSLGLGAGIVTTNTAWSDLVVLDPGDESYLVDSRIFVVPYFSFGTYFSQNNYYAGFSIPRLISYEFNSDRNRYSLSTDPGQYNYMFTTGYVFNIAPKFRFSPSTLLTYTPREKILFDINAHVNFMDRFWVGASYRNGRAISGLFQFQINNQLKVAYTYNFDINKLARYNNGTHEIMIRYEFRYKVEVVNPLNF